MVVLPKAADNDIPGTDKAIGFDTAREIATQAIDRLHSTANATHRIMIVELAGVSTGWLTLGAGLAAGADVILIPEFPYDFGLISAAIGGRQRRAGTSHSWRWRKTRSQELVEIHGAGGASRPAIRARQRGERGDGRIGKVLRRNNAAGVGWKTKPACRAALPSWARWCAAVPTASDRLLAANWRNGAF